MFLSNDSHSPLNQATFNYKKLSFENKDYWLYYPTPQRQAGYEQVFSEKKIEV